MDKTRNMVLLSVMHEFETIKSNILYVLQLSLVYLGLPFETNGNMNFDENKF